MNFGLLGHLASPYPPVPCLAQTGEGKGPSVMWDHAEGVHIEQDRISITIMKKPCVIKYSYQAVIQSVVRTPGRQGFSLSVKDNGQGSDPLNFEAGNGLRNVKNRCTRLLCRQVIHTSPGEGCLVEIEGLWSDAENRSVRVEQRV